MDKEERLINQLEECLASIRAGDSVASCLARYPDDADELAPLLHISLALEGLPQPGPAKATTQAAKSQFLALAERKSSTRFPALGIFAAFRSSFKRVFTLPAPLAPVRSLATTAAALALIVLIGWGVIHASSGSLPGDPLYAFKLLGEDVQRVFTLDDGRFGLDTAFGERRRWEVEQLLAEGREQPVQFSGILRQQSASQVWVEDIQVILDDRTKVQGELAPGIYVTVVGLTQQPGTVLAQNIAVEGERIVGVIQFIAPGEWHVAGRQMRIHDATLILGRFQEGDCVEVRTRRYVDGVLYAQEIRASADCQEDTDLEVPTPTATVTATPTPIPTPKPTTTPAPLERTPTWTPTSTPRPTVTASPTIAPSPTTAPSPTVTPGPTEAPAPTATPEPTQPSRPTTRPPSTATPPPTSPPEPTDAPEPTEEIRPTDTPKPTEEPEPTDEPEPTHERAPTDVPLPTAEP